MVKLYMWKRTVLKWICLWPIISGSVGLNNCIIGSQKDCDWKILRSYLAHACWHTPLTYPLEKRGIKTSMSSRPAWYIENYHSTRVI